MSEVLSLVVSNLRVQEISLQLIVVGGMGGWGL